MKVLIVDDDNNIIEMIQSLIPWNDIGIREVHTAEQGQVALDIIRREMPDIIISDIEMPVMDGLKMAEVIAEEDELDPELIFLTCHADFEYAKQAIRLGACDYLLKPFFPEELIALLSKTVVRCKEKKKLLEQNAESGEADAGNQDYVLRGYIQDILDRTIESDAEEIRRVAEKRGLDMDPEAENRLLAVGIRYEEALKDFGKSDLAFIFRNIISEILYGLEREERDFLVEYMLPNYYTAYATISEQEYQKAVFEEKFKRLGDVLKQYLGLYPTCIISETVKPELYADKKEQVDQILAQNVSASAQVIFMEEMEDEQVLHEGKINQQEITQYLRDRKKNELFLYMRHFLEQKGSSLTAAEMKMIHHDLMQVFYGYLYENKISTRELMEDEIGRQIHESAEYSAINMMKYASYMYDYVIEQIETVRESDSVIERAKKYIASHCTENIGRTEIAEEVMLAPNYLSMLFHKETGQTIREYINLCRIEEAKKIMESTNNSITEIALQIGFDNITYFSTIFKKYTGTSPAEYRRGLKKNG